MKQRVTTFTLAAVLLLFLVEAWADDWPQFRGPGRDGLSSETNLFAEWPKSGPQELWRVELGGGYSGISVADGRVMTLSAETGGEHLLAIDATSGREIWRYRTDRNRPDGEGGGPRSTPSIFGDVAYVTSAYGKLHALKATDGSLLWQVDLVRELGASVPEWGYSSSPLVEGDVVYVETGGGKNQALTALDRHSGELIWQGGSNGSGYSSPLIVEVGGVRQLLTFGADAITAVSPETGREFWRVPWKTSFEVNAAMPVFGPPDMLLFSSGYGVGAMAVRFLSDNGQLRMEKLWQNRNFRNKFSSSITHGGFIYGFDEDILKCIEFATGKEKWHERRSHGSIIYADGRLLVLDGSGQLFLAEATAEGWNELGRAPILRGRTWNHPALADGVVYARSSSELVAVRVGGQEAGATPEPEVSR